MVSHSAQQPAVTLAMSKWQLGAQAAMVSILTEQLSQEHGLAWEFYTGLFACGCLWVLLQALHASK